MFSFKSHKVALDKKIGKGGFGQVYPYQRNQDDKKWVVKVSIVKHRDLPTAMSEITHSFRCTHPNLLVAKGFYLEPHGIANPRSLEVWENFKEWKVIIKLPRMKDESLGGKIRRYRSDNQAFSEEKVLKLFYEIASGLKYLHENKIAHRDLKPDNVLFNNEDIAVLSDFGLSTFTEDETDYYLKDDAGTKTHKAPEPQLKLKHRGLYPTDIWSLGVLIFEVCNPLGDNNDGTGEERQEKFKRDIEKLNYSSFLKELLLQMLLSEPTQRIKINDLWEKLEEKLTGIPQRTTEMMVEDQSVSMSKNEEKKNLRNEQMQVEESKGEVLNGRRKHGEFRDYEEDDRETSVLSVRDELRKDQGALFDLEADGIDQSLKITSKKRTGADTKEITEQTLGNLLEKLTTEVIHKNCRKLKELSIALPSGSDCSKIEGHSFARLFGANQLSLEKLNINLQGTSVNRDGLKELAKQISDNLKNLQDLHLIFPFKTKGSGVKTFTEKVFSSVKGLKRIELVLEQAKISKEEFKEIGAHISKNLADLEHLTLDFKPAAYSGSQLPKDGFKDLFVPIISGCQKLKHLDLNFSGSDIASTGLKELLPVEANSLEYLKLNFKGCKQMRDKTAAEIAEYVIPRLKNLKHLELNYSECKIADNGLGRLVEQISLNIPDLQHLLLAFAGNSETGGSLITGEGLLNIVNPIKSHLKKLELLHLDFEHPSSSVREEKPEVKKAFSNVIKDFKLI